MKTGRYVSTLLLMSSALLGKAQVSHNNIPDTVISLNDIVVSANKAEENHRLVSQQIAKLDYHQISDAQAQTTADLLSNAGGLFVQRSQMGGGSPVLRGFEANKVLLVVDGIRMNNLIYRGGHLQNVITIDNASLDRVEILYGPSSTMYGSDALGGVIHFFTRNPTFAKEVGRKAITANAFTRYGSVNNEGTAHADFSIGGKRVASLTSLTVSSFGDLKSGRQQNPFYDSIYGERPFYVTWINGVDSIVANDDKYKQVSSGYRQYDFMQKLAFRQNDKVMHLLNLQYSTSTDIPRYDRLTDVSGAGVLKSAQWYYGPQKRLLTAYTVEKKDSNAFFQNKRVILSYQDVEESRHTRSYQSKNLDHRVEHVGVAGVNIDYTRRVHSHTIRAGIEQQTNTLQSTACRENIETGANASIDTRYPDGDNRMLNNAVYGSHTWQITDKLTLTDGLRLGYVSLYASFVDTSFFSFPFTAVRQNNFVYSGSVGIIKMFRPDLKVALLGATGYRVPNIDDLAKVFESVPGSLIVPSNNLQPEKTISTELSASKVFGSTALWDAGVYYTVLSDAIVTSAYRFNGQDTIMYNGVASRVLANQNQNSAFIYGASTSFKVKAGKWLAVMGGMNYTYGRIRTDSVFYPLDHIPPLQARLQVSYNRNKMGTDFFVNGNGAKNLRDYYQNGEDNERYATPDGMPAWITLNVRARYALHKNILLQVGVDNILDTQYRIFASGINAPGRNVFASVSFRY